MLSSGGEERFEDAGARLRVHAAAVVLDGDARVGARRQSRAQLPRRRAVEFHPLERHRNAPGLAAQRMPGVGAQVHQQLLDLHQARRVQRAQAQVVDKGHDGGRGADPRPDEPAFSRDEGDQRDVGAGDGRRDATQAIERRIGLGGQQAQLPKQVEAARVVSGSVGVHPSGRSCISRIAPIPARRAPTRYPGRGRCPRRGGCHEPSHALRASTRG